MKKKVAIFYSNRAEKSILDPVAKVIKDHGLSLLYHDFSEAIEIQEDKDLSKIYNYIYNYVDRENVGQVILCGDRREMIFAALALFLKNIPFTQLVAGDLSESLSTVDDYFRHMITLISQKQISFSESSHQNTKDLLKMLNIKPNATLLNQYPSLWGAEPSSRKVKENYDLVLMHPQSLSREKTIQDKEEVEALIQKSYYTENKTIVIIKGNRDKNYEIFYDYWEVLEKRESEDLYWSRQNGNVKIFENLKKEDFWSLIKYCDRFITNSSCSFYEAPAFLNLEQIIRIGDRNNGREIVKQNLEQKIDPKLILSSILFNYER
tara:strand:- start:14 stop:976 length:963 start_codon:yes stop_codon:yes gene_type:complete